ncbi:MAG: hypothetical protein AB7L92_02395 [Alphaproteobacteria bacterium]
MHPYATRAYADSLAHWGKTLAVPEWGCHVIVRDIDGTHKDAAGVYPITPLLPDTDIQGGVERLKGEGLVSVVLVLDDFHRPPLEVLSQAFDRVVPFKPHYLYRPSLGGVNYDSHHKRALKKAHKQVRSGIVDLKKDAASWCALYDELIRKLDLTGLHAFGMAHHAALADIPGFVAMGSWVGDELVSCHVWVEHDGFCHSHLVASNPVGYDTRAGYATNAASMEYFQNATVLNFGGGAGNSVDADDGLARFKRGFSNDMAQSYICGAVLDKNAYSRLVAARKFTLPVKFFPAYRAP